MRDTLLNYIDRFRRDRHERVVLGFVLLILAVMVSLIVYWQLRYTGITMTNETYCGYEEHIHTDECYEFTLVCGLDETEGHTHDESCYDDEGNLICSLSECEPHTHTDECYEYVLVCGYEEHTHTVECLINLNADVEDATVWEATLPELSGDLQTDVVNIAQSQLGYTESTANFSVSEDGETRYGYTRYGAWYGNEYGTWDAMFAAFCLYYAGIDESVFPLNSGAYAWAVQLKEAGVYAEASETVPSAGDLVFFDSDGDDRIDRVGIVTAVDESASMVTIIEGDYTVGEADTVSEHIYPFSNTTIVGYGILPVTEEDEETDDEDTTFSDETEEEVEVAEDITYTASDSGVTVTVIAPEGALPDGAILSVTLVDEESEEYAVAAEAVGYEEDSGIATVSEDDADSESTEETSTALAVLDISFTADGETVEPTEPVTVIIDASSLMTADADTSTLEVQHLEETADGITPVLVADATEDTDGTIDTETAVAEFTVESFSSFTLRWSYQQGYGGTGYTNSYDVWVYLTGTTTEISSTSNTYTYSSSVTVNGTTVTASGTTDLTTLLTISGYEFDYATISYTYRQNNNNRTGTINNATSITYSNNQGGKYTFVSSTDGTTEQGNVQSITIYLYYKVASASITINKYETDTTTLLSGATLTLTNTSGNSLESVSVSGASSYSASGSVLTLVTGSSAITITGLPEGSYTLTETSAPDYYNLADGSCTFSISGTTISASASGDYSYTASSSNAGTVTVEDDPKTVEVNVSKVYVEADGSTTVDSSETSSLTATFTLDDNQSVSVTGASTSSTAFELKYNTTYTLSETAPSDDYAAVSGVTITVDSDGGVSVSGSDYASISGNTITITNKKSVSVTVEKVYVDANGDVTTSGIGDLEAEFTVNGETYTVTGADTFEVTGLTDGTYTLSETAAGGYTAVDDVTITVSNGEISIGTVDNVSLSDGVITVTNAPDANHKYAGMTYAIVNVARGYALTSDKNGDSYLNGLAVTTEVDGDDTYATAADGTSEVTVWTFVATSTANVYYITDGNGNYLNISSSAVTVSTPQEILVTEGSGSYEGMVRLTPATSKTYAVDLYGSQTYFGAWYSSDANEWQTLCLVKKKDGLYITDDLISSGRYIATLVVNGVEVDLTDSKYTVTWYKAGYAFDSSYNCYVSGDYSEVTNSDALGDNNTTVNVAIDGGGLCYYYVTVTYTDESGNEVTLESEVEHVPYAAELLNCSFEWNSSGTQDQSYIPFWSTTSQDGKIEIGAYSSDAGSYGTQYIYAGGSYETAGANFAELNANYEGALYQDVLTIGGESLDWAFYHRARTADGGSWTSSSVTDEMYVVIMSAEDAEKLLSGIDQTEQQDTVTAMIESILNGAEDGSGTYTLVDGDYEGDTVSATIWTVSSTNGYQTGEWTYNSGSYTVPEGQYVTRFFFVSKTSGYKDSGKSNGYTVGNLIDYATFSQNITYVIEYWTRDSNDGEYTLVKTERDTVYPYTNVYADISEYTSTYGLVGSVTGTASGGSNPTTYDATTTTGMRVTSNTMYLSVYLSTPVVTVVKHVSGLTESQLDEMLDDGTYTVTFTITPVGGGTSTTVTLTVGETGIASDYTIALTAGVEYTITETVNYTGSFLDDYDCTVTVSGATTSNSLETTYTFTPTDNSSLTITFTNTYAEVVTGGPEMPQTGGRGTKLYTMVGLLLICSGGYLLYRKQRRKCKWRWNI